MASRDEYVAMMKAKLDDWNKEIAKLEDTLAKAGEDTRTELRPYLNKVREAREILVTRLSDLKESGEATWESSRAEVEHVWKTFKQSVNYFKSQL